MHLLPVTTVGVGAARVLTTGGTGRIIAAFHRSFYAAFDTGLVCIGPPEFGPGPLHLLARTDDVASWRDRLVVGGRIEARDDRLIVDGLCFDARGMVPWRAPPCGIVTADGLAAGLARLAARSRDDHPVGLGRLIEPLCYGELPTALAEGDPVLGRALPVIQALMTWACRAKARDGVPVPAVESLLGLGPGLTPSGDDFLAGFLVALRRLGATALADQLAVAVMPFAATMTNAISAAYLSWAAEGEATAGLIEAFTAIATGGYDLDPHIARVAAIGHSSGWDGLTGMVLAAVTVGTAFMARRNDDADGVNQSRLG